MTAQTGPVRRVLRRLVLGSGPLERGSDRLEFCSRVVCVAVLTLAVPVALTVGTVVGTDASQRAHDQATTRHQQEAVLLADAAGTGRTEPDALSSATPGRWRAPDGGSREGMVLAPRDAEAGARVTIWVDAAGDQTDRPLDPAVAATAAALGGVFTFCGLAALAVGGHVAVCQALWRYRARQWAREWREVEPVWAGRS